MYITLDHSRLLLYLGSLGGLNFSDRLGSNSARQQTLNPEEPPASTKYGTAMSAPPQKLLMVQETRRKGLKWMVFQLRAVCMIQLASPSACRSKCRTVDAEVQFCVYPPI